MTLVVRTIASNGNYDYIFDWEFQTDGIIRVKVRQAVLYYGDLNDLIFYVLSETPQGILFQEY